MKAIFTTTVLLFSCMTFQAQVRYVNPNATGANNGTSWENAWTDLQTALQQTFSGQIWVAEGIYKPTTGTERNISFEPNPNIHLYGGFPKSGNPSWGQRDWDTYPSVLSGDIGVENDSSDNSYHIMNLTSWIPFENVIDGFVFTGGNSDYAGAGLEISGLFNFDSRATIRHCTFRENYAYYEGAAISSSWSDLIIENCRFESNHAGYGGGAISYFSDHFSTDAVRLVCRNSTFRNNSAGYGGGAADTRGYNHWYNCLFEGNFANYEGGVFSHFRDGKVEAVNCTFVDNVANGDGSVLDIFSWEDTVVVGASFANCIFNRNLGDGLLTKGGAVDSVLVEYSFLETCPPGIYCGNGNIFDDDPGFVDPYNFHLSLGSPCIDAGSNAYLPTDITSDLDGNTRIVGSKIDLGVFEFGSMVSTDEETDMPIFVFPNPVSGQATITLSLNDASPVTISLHDATGRLLISLGEKAYPAGTHQISFDLSAAPKGLHLLTLRTEQGVGTVKVMKE